MPRYFLVSSALVKRYHQESGTDDVERLFSQTDNRFFVSRLALVEVCSCFARLVREKVLTEADFAKLTSRLDADVASGTFLVAAVSSARLHGASSVLATYGLAHPIRTLDAIHLATAQALENRAHLAAFVAADKRLIIGAAACGFTILDVS